MMEYILYVNIFEMCLYKCEMTVINLVIKMRAECSDCI